MHVQLTNKTFNKILLSTGITTEGLLEELFRVHKTNT